MTVKEKILLYLDSKGVRKNEVFESIGLAPSNFKGAAKTSALGSDKLVKILTLCPDLSVDWLLFDKGEMIKRDTEPTLSSNLTTTNSIEDKLLSMIQEKDSVIREQAEEIGRLREQIHHMRQRFEKDAANASTDTTANVG